MASIKEVVVQIIATALFLIVFAQLFIVLSIYLWKTIYDYFKAGKAKKPEKPPPEVEQQESVKLHISEGLIQVNRLPEEQGKAEE